MENLINSIKDRIRQNPPLKGTVKLVIPEEGTIFIEDSAVTNAEDKDPDCTLTANLETFHQILDGTLNGPAAFMLGRLKIKGSMGLAMKISSFLES